MFGAVYLNSESFTLSGCNQKGGHFCCSDTKHKKKCVTTAMWAASLSQILSKDEGLSLSHPDLVRHYMMLFICFLLTAMQFAAQLPLRHFQLRAPAGESKNAAQRLLRGRMPRQIQWVKWERKFFKTWLRNTMTGSLFIITSVSIFRERSINLIKLMLYHLFSLTQLYFMDKRSETFSSYSISEY